MIYSKFTLGRGYRLQVTRDSKLKLLDYENNELNVLGMKSEKPFEDLTLNSDKVVDLLEDPLNDWIKQGGNHDVEFVKDYDNTKKCIIMKGHNGDEGNKTWSPWSSGEFNQDIRDHMNTWFATNKTYKNFRLQLKARCPGNSLNKEADGNIQEPINNGGVIPRGWVVDSDITDSEGKVIEYTLFRGIQCEVHGGWFGTGDNGEP